MSNLTMKSLNTISNLSVVDFVNHSVFRVPQNLRALIRYFEKKLVRDIYNPYLNTALNQYSATEQQEIYLLAKKRQQFENQARAYAKEMQISVPRAKKILKGEDIKDKKSFKDKNAIFNRVIGIYALDHGLSFYEAKIEFTALLTKQDLENQKNKNLETSVEKEPKSPNTSKVFLINNQNNLGFYQELENKTKTVQSQLDDAINLKHNKCLKKGKMKHFLRKNAFLQLLKSYVEKADSHFTEKNLAFVISQGAKHFHCNVRTLQQDVKDLNLRTFL